MVCELYLITLLFLKCGQIYQSFIATGFCVTVKGLYSPRLKGNSPVFFYCLRGLIFYIHGSDPCGTILVSQWGMDLTVPLPCGRPVVQTAFISMLFFGGCFLTLVLGHSLLWEGTVTLDPSTFPWRKYQIASQAFDYNQFLVWVWFCFVFFNPSNFLSRILQWLTKQLTLNTASRIKNHINYKVTSYMEILLGISPAFKQDHCHGLSVCVPPKFIRWNPRPQGDDMRTWVLWA